MAFSTRRGGRSALPVDGLNLGLHVGDDRQLVLGNRHRFLAAAGLNLDNLIMAEQTHGQQVRLVGDKDAGAGAYRADEALSGVDAMVTATPGVALGGCYADCVPVFIVDTALPAVAVIHAGWRGTAGGIVPHTWSWLCESFASCKDDCVAYIGPAIGMCCYEVGESVAAAMREQWWWPQVSRRRSNGLWYVDLALANQLQLEARGLHTENCGLCTSCDPRFYSHRRDGGNTGRMLGMISIRT